LRGTSFGPPKELLLNLNRDLIQPPFSPLYPFLMVAGMGLKFSYPIFSGTKLSSGSAVVVSTTTPSSALGRWALRLCLLAARGSAVLAG
jgi:hypothetical protein